MKAVVGLGTLEAVTVRGKDGKDRTFQLQDAPWLAWDPGSKNLIVGRIATGATPKGGLPPAVTRIHRRFHETSPSRVVRVLFPDNKSSAEDIGLLVGLVYRVPSTTKSPGKNPYTWVHAFGDHGERGHGENDGVRMHRYPEKYMPGLRMTSAGDIFIVRRPGNKYYVTEWLYW